MEWVLLFLGILIGLLFVPVVVRLEVHPETGLSAKSITWGGFEFSTQRGDQRSMHAPPPKRRAKKNQASAPLPPRKVWAILRTDGFMSSLGRFLGRLLAHLRPRQSDIVVMVGLEDPASTGCLWGALTPLTFLLFRHPEWGVVLEPDFSRNCFEAEGHATVRVIPGVFLGLVVGYLLSPTVVRATTRGIRA